MRKLLITTALLLASVTVNAESLEADKVLHIKASILATTFFYSINEYAGRSHWETLGECMAVGIGKELYDEYDYGGFDTKDLAADAVGCVGGLLLTDTAWKLIAEDSSYGIQYTLHF